MCFASGDVYLVSSFLRRPPCAQSSKTKEGKVVLSRLGTSCTAGPVPVHGGLTELIKSMLGLKTFIDLGEMFKTKIKEKGKIHFSAFSALQIGDILTKKIFLHFFRAWPSDNSAV